jgi:hypothetical protein
VKDLAAQVAEQARFYARELVARFERDAGELSAVLRDRMLFAAEMGYLRGHGDGMHAASTMYDEARKKVLDGTE